jgi:hypothetical protein
VNVSPFAPSLLAICSYTPFSAHHDCIAGSFVTLFARISNDVCGRSTVLL